MCIAQIITKVYSYLMVYECLQGDMPLQEWKESEVSNWIINNNNPMHTDCETMAYHRAKRIALICEVNP